MQFLSPIALLLFAILPIVASILNHEQDKRQLIAGGVETGGAVDYAVIIQHDGSFVCGGVLIANDIVLTAAECKASVIDSYEILVGVYDRTEVPPVTQSVVKELVHPDYDFLNQDNDIMLLKLNESIVGYDFIEMNDDPEVPMDHGMLNYTGWGIMEDSEEFSNVLRTVEIVYVPRDECYDSLTNAGLEAPSESDLCTFAFFKGGCDGDIGGPLILDRDGTPLLVGILSQPFQCGELFAPPQFSMRMSSFVGWINYSICYDLRDSGEEYDFCADVTVPVAAPSVSPAPSSPIVSQMPDSSTTYIASYIYSKYLFVVSLMLIASLISLS